MKNKAYYQSKTIDCHSHIGVFLSGIIGSKYPYVHDMISMLDTMEINDIDCAIAFPMPSYYKKSFNDNSIESTFAALEKIPYKFANYRLLRESHELANQKILPFLMFSVNYGVDEQISLISELEQEYYIYGLKYYPDLDNTPAYDLLTKGKKIIDFAVSRNYPICIHSSVDAVLGKSSFSSPIDIVRLAYEVPLLRISLAHAGHFHATAIKYIIENDLKNVYIDVSPFKHICYIRTVNKSNLALNLPYEKPLEVLRCLTDELPENIIWGTDAPFCFTCDLNNSEHNKNHSGFHYKDNVEVLRSLPNEKITDISSKNTYNFIFGNDLSSI